MTVRQIDANEVTRRAGELQEKLAVLRGQLADRSVFNQTVTSPKGSAENRPMTNSVPPFQRNPDRPQNLDQMVGQEDVVLRLRLAISGAKLRGEKVPHILISGAAGYGKSSLAQIISDEVGCPLVSTNGVLLKKSGDVIGLLLSVDGPCVVFIDEAQSMAKIATEAVFQAMEDGAVDMLAGSGPDTEATTRQLPGVVIVAATTHPGKLSASFRDRFGVQLSMSEYSDDELAEIIRRYWKTRGVKHFRGEDSELAKRSRGVPRRAVMLAGRTLDYVAVNDQPAITTGTVANVCGVLGIDSMGLDDVDRKIIAALTGPFAAKAVGLDNLAAYLDVEPSTIQDAHEGFLVRSGLVVRTGRGRTATAKAYELMKGEA